jgi:hypothetical protein
VLGVRGPGAVGGDHGPAVVAAIAAVLEVPLDDLVRAATGSTDTAVA